MSFLPAAAPTTFGGGNRVSGGGGHTIAKRVELAERQTLALKLLNSGHTLSEIAGTLGISEDAARMAIRVAIRKHPVDDLEGWRSVELARLENLHKMVMERIETRVEQGGPDALDLRSVDRILTIAQRRAKLLGLDMPVRMEVLNGPTTRIIEVSAWPTDSSGAAIATSDQGVELPEADHRDGGRDGQRQDVVRPALAAPKTH